MQDRPHLPTSTVVATATVGSVLLTVVHLVNAATFESRLLDMDLENNVPTWFSSGVFLGACLAALAAVGAARGRTRVVWTALAAVCAAMSADEVASVHEEAGRRIGADATLSVAQPAVALVVVVLLLVAARAVAGRPGRLLVVAAGVLAVSQACASTGGLLADGPAVPLLETVEDLTEMLTGVALLAASLVAAGARLDLRPRALADELRSWWRGADGLVTSRDALGARRRGL